MTARAAALLIVCMVSGCAPDPSASPRTATGPRAAGPHEIVVFAAASLTDVAESLADSFGTVRPDVRVTISVGASSALARQIEAGAPADVFLSASPEWTDTLAAAGRLSGPVRTLASNRLVVLGPTGAGAMASVSDLLGIRRLALADPSHVPAGQYARAAMTAAGLWDRLAPRVVPLPDVRAAAAAVESGAADAAIVYASDARVARRAQVRLVWPGALTPDIRLVGAVVRQPGDRSAARAFLGFVTVPERAATWQEFGFVPLSAPAPTGAGRPATDAVVR